MSLVLAESFAIQPQDMATYGKWWALPSSSGGIAGGGTASRIAGRSAGSWAYQTSGQGGSSGPAYQYLQANLGVNTQRITLGFAFQIITVPNGPTLAFLADVNGASITLTIDTNLRQLVVNRGATEIYRFSTSYAMNRWHYGELALFVSSTAGWVEGRLDSVAQGGYYGTTTIANPNAAPTLGTATTGGSLAAGNYTVGYTWLGSSGETQLSPTAVITTTGATSTITVTPPALPAGVTGYNVYIGAVGTTTPLYKQNVAAVTAASYTRTAAPATNTVQPPASNTAALGRAAATGNTQPGSVAGMRFVNFGPSSIGANTSWTLQYADVVIMNGAGTVNNDFLGDIKVLYLPQSAQGFHQDWQRAGSTPGGGVATPTVAPTLGSAATGGTVQAGTYIVGYTWVTANGETTLSPTATVTPSGTTATITTTPPALPAGATGWNLYMSQAGGATLTKQNATPLVGTNNVLTAPPTNTGAAPPANNTSGTNWQATSVLPIPGDTSYVQATAAGSIDTYRLSPLPSTVTGVLAVQVGMAARKTDAGARTLAPLVRLGGVDYPVGIGTAMQQSYGWYSSGPLETEPSGAGWTIADVNAAEYGPDLTA